MSFLTNDEIDGLIKEHDSADPERQQQIAQQFYEDRQARKQADYQAGIENAQKMFTDPQTLGGAWTPQQSQMSKLLGTDEQVDKQRFANISYIAALSGKSRSDVTNGYEPLRDAIAQQYWGKPQITDSEFYSTVQKKIQDDQARQKELSETASAGASAALMAALDGKPLDWAANYHTVKPGVIYDSQDMQAFREASQKSYSLAVANKDLFQVANDVLAKETGRTDLDSGKTQETLTEAASRIAALPVDERQAVYGMLTLYAQQHGAKNPVDFADKLGVFASQVGKSAERGAVSLWNSPLDMRGDVQLQQMRNAAQSPDAKVDETGNLVSFNPGAIRQAFGATPLVQEIGSDEVSTPTGELHTPTPAERKQIIGKIDQQLQTNQVLRELRNFAETKVDPVKAVMGGGMVGNAAERGMYALAGSAPIMAEAAIPAYGLALSAVSMSGQAYDSLKTKYPDMNPETAATVASVAGVAQGAAFKLPISAMAGKLPFLSKAISNLTTPTSNFWARAGINLAAQTAEQTAVMSGINLISAASQSIISALDHDVPNVNWKEQIGETWQQLPETLFMVLPMALVGAGSMAMTESKFVTQVVKSPDALQGFGIKPEDAQRIAEAANGGDSKGAETLFRQAWQARTPDEIKAAGDKMAAQVQRAKEMQQSPETPTLRATADGGFQVLNSDGTISSEHADEASALIAHTDKVRGELTGDHESQAMNDLKSFFEEKDPNRRVEIIKESKTLQDALKGNDATPEQVAERMRVAGYAEGVSPEGVAVHGENVSEIRNNLYSDVSRIYQGGSVDTIIEERAHGDFKKALADGRITMDDALAAVREWAKEHPEFELKDGQTPAQRETVIHEAVADMVKAKFFGSLKQIEGIPASVRGFIARAVTYFKAVFKRAATLRKLGDAGKLTDTWQDFLAESVGLKDSREVERHTNDQAAEIAGQNYSIEQGSNREQPAQRSETSGVTEAASGGEAGGSEGGNKSGDLSAQRGVGQVRETVANAASPVKEAFLQNPVISSIIEAGKLLSQSGARKKLGAEKFRDNRSLWDDSPERLSHPTHNEIYSPDGLTPDEMHAHLIEEGLMRPDSSVSDMWQKIGQASESAKRISESQRVHEAQIKKQESQFKAFEKARTGKGKSVSVDDLSIGDSVSMRGDKMTVTDIDENGGVTLKGEKFGDQFLPAGEKIRGEHIKGEEPPTFDNVPFSIAPATHIDRITAKLDALKRDPDERLAIYERAKEKLQALDRSSRFVIGVEKDKLGADKASLDRTKMLHSFATLDAIASTLPPDVRAKIGGSAYQRLAELKTADARTRFIEKQLGKVDRALEGVLKKEYRERIDGLIEKSQPQGGGGEKTVGKIGVAGHRAFKEIERVSELSGEAVQKELDGISKSFEETDQGDTKAILALTEQAHFLEAFGALKDKSADELASAYRLADEIYKNGRSSWLAQVESRLEQNNQLRTAIIEGAGKRGTDSQLIESKEANKGLKGGVKGLAQRFRSFTQVLEVALGRDNEVTKRWHDADVKASLAKETALVNSHREFQQLIKQIYGERKGSLERGRKLWALRTERNIKVEKVEGRKTESVDIPIDKAEDILSGKLEPESFGLKENDRDVLQDAVKEWAAGKSRKESVTIETEKHPGTKEKVPLTAMEGVYLTQLARQSRYAKALEKNGWTPDVIAEIENALPKEAKQIRDWMANKYAKGYEPLNKIFQSMHGIDLPREDGYAPARFKHDGAEVDQSPYGGDVMFDGGMNTGFLRTRKNHSARPELADALTNYFQHVAATEHFKAYAEFSREMNGVLRSQDVRNSLEAAKGKSVLDPLLDWVKTINDGGLKAKSLGRELDNIARHLSGVSAYLGLAWNLGTASKHLLSAFNAAAEMPLSSYAKGFAKLLSGQLEVSHIWNSDFIQNRVHGDWSPEQKAAIGKSWETAPSRRQLFLDLGTHILPFVDTVATTGGAAIAYDYHFNQAMKMPGMTKEHAGEIAMQAAQDTVYRTAYPASMTQRSLAEIGASPMGKLLWLFATPGRQKAGMFITAVQHAMSGEGSAADLARVMFVTHIVGGLFAQGISSAWRSAHDDQESDFFNLHDWEPRDFLIAALSGPMAEMPLLRDLISAAEGKSSHTAVGTATRGASSVWKLMESATGKLSDGERKSRDKDPSRWYMNKAADAMNLVGFGMSNGFESLGVVARLLNDRRKEADKLLSDGKKQSKHR